MVARRRTNLAMPLRPSIRSGLCGAIGWKHSGAIGPVNIPSASIGNGGCVSSGRMAGRDRTMSRSSIAASEGANADVHASSPSGRGPQGRTGGTGRHSHRVRPPDRRAPEPDRSDHCRQTLDHRRHRIAPGPLVRVGAAILVEPPGPIRSGASRQGDGSGNSRASYSCCYGWLAHDSFGLKRKSGRFLRQARDRLLRYAPASAVPTIAATTNRRLTGERRTVDDASEPPPGGPALISSYPDLFRVSMRPLGGSSGGGCPEQVRA